jgi:hypothetical protein
MKFLAVFEKYVCYIRRSHKDKNPPAGPPAI